MYKLFMHLDSRSLRDATLRHAKQLPRASRDTDMTKTIKRDKDIRYRSAQQRQRSIIYRSRCFLVQLFAPNLCVFKGAAFNRFQFPKDYCHGDLVDSFTKEFHFILVVNMKFISKD